MSFTEIVWSPNHDDQFSVICKHNLFLFKIRDLDSFSTIQTSDGLVIGDKCKFSLIILNIQNKLDSVKAYAWQPCLDGKQENPAIPSYLVALGFVLGNVKLTSLQDIDSHQDRFRLNNKELAFRSNRSCTFLAWNPWKTNLLAQGLERGRFNREPSILIWDVVSSNGGRLLHSESSKHLGQVSHHQIPTNQLTNGSTEMLLKFATSGGSLFGPEKSSSFGSGIICDRPLCDACHNEAVSSFAWLSKGSFIVGLMGKYLKVYDISDPSKACQIISTRLVNGLTVDPLFTSRISSFYQHQIGLWTCDNLEKPVYTITESRNVLCIKWSPLRLICQPRAPEHCSSADKTRSSALIGSELSGWLGVLLTDSTFIKVYNTQPSFGQIMDESDQCLLELRAMSSHESEIPIVSFVWHGTVVNCIITIDQAGRLNVAYINDRATVAWTRNQTLIWTSGNFWLSFNRTGLSSSTGQVLRPNSAGVDQAGVASSAISDGSPTDLSGLISSRVTELVNLFEGDIASIMQKRASLGYGLGIKESKYSDLVADDSQLRSMWILIEYLQRYIEDWGFTGKSEDAISFSLVGKNAGFRSTPTTYGGERLRCQGALSILCSTASTSPSEMIDSPYWHGIESRLSFPRYSSPRRSWVLRLCMWPLNASSDVQRAVFESVCEAFEFERAAAMALINLHFDWALSFLSRASEARRSMQDREQQPIPKSASSDYLLHSASSTSMLSPNESDLVGLALSGFSDPCNQLWRNTCADLVSRLKDPYLKVMFKFLTCRGRDFNDILNNENLILIDRLAFACLYLDDDELQLFVRTTCDKMVNAGRLEAVLLTGLSSAEFIELVQQYLDRTGDVQSAAILGLHACALNTISTTNNQNQQPVVAPSVATVVAAPVQGEVQPPPQLNASTRRGLRFRPLTVTPLPSSTLNTGASGAASDICVVVQLGGRRLSNWVQSYRDLLDQWRMWFHRADFDNYYRSRSVSNFLNVSLRPPAEMTSVRPTPKQRIDGGSVLPLMDFGGAKVNVNTTAGVQSIGLTAAANQIFVACTYCGWRLGNLIRSSGGCSDDGQIISGSGTMPIGVVTGEGQRHTSGEGLMAVPGTPTTPTGNLQMHGGGGKQTICWHCRKPLPRCSICLMHMGTAIGNDASSAFSTASKSRMNDTIGRATILPQTRTGGVGPGNTPTLPVSSWFVWCQACRHGGHAGHLYEWFHGGGGDCSGRRSTTIPASFIECPVNGCVCRCASLDIGHSVPDNHYAIQKVSNIQEMGNLVASGSSSACSDDDTEILQEEDDERDEVEEIGDSLKRTALRPEAGWSIRTLVDPIVGLMASVDRDQNTVPPTTLGLATLQAASNSTVS